MSMTARGGSRFLARLKGRWANVLLVVLSTLLSLAAAEFALRTYIKPRPLVLRQFLEHMGVTDSDRNWQRDPELGWMIKPNAQFWHTSPFGEFETEIATDELGMRIPLVAGAPPAHAERNILFVGDSGTAAYEVPYEETFVAKVEAKLNAGGARARTFNAGIRGYSTEQAYKRMRALLEKSELGVTDVVYLFGLNDPFENMSLHFPVRLMSKPGAYLDRDGTLKFRSLDYPVGIMDPEALFVTPDGDIGVLPMVGRTSMSKWLMRRTLQYKEAGGWFDSLYTVGLARLALQMAFEPRDVEAVRGRYPYIRPDYAYNSGFGGYMADRIEVSWEPGSYPLRLLEEILRQMNQEAERHGVRFWVALPLTTGPFSLPFFKEVAARHGIAVIDPVSNGFRDRWECDGAVVYKLDGHFTACGHSGQAEAIAAALEAGRPAH
jgi:hypothetical protein